MSAARLIVSGGTGGLGRAVVDRLIGGGARVAVPYRGQASWDELRAAHPSDVLWGAAADLVNPQDTRRFVNEAASWLGGLDGVACLAGAWAGGRTLEEAPADEWERMQAANVDSARLLCAAALPLLLEDGGSVVTVSSRLAGTGGPGAAAYAASKAAIESLTRTLALENAQRRVRFNCIVPRTIDTPANRAAMPGADASQWTSPEAIARIVAFLLSPDSACVTGAIIPVDASTA